MPVIFEYCNIHGHTIIPFTRSESVWPYLHTCYSSVSKGGERKNNSKNDDDNFLNFKNGKAQNNE